MNEKHIETGSNWCSEKNIPIRNNNKDIYTLVDVCLYSTVTLACHYCNENDDNMPKLWFKKPRGFQGVEKEIELNFKDNQEDNRIFVMLDHTMVIRNISEEDNGLYLCHGPLGEDSDSRYNFVIDVTSNTPTIEITEDNKNIRTHSLENIFFKQIDETNVKFLESNETDYIKLRNEGVVMNIITTWAPWEPCNGCLKKRKRKRKCLLKPTAIRNNTPRIPESEIKKITLRKLSENEIKEKIFLLQYDFSCRSLSLARLFPNVLKNLERIPNYYQMETCYAPCKKIRSGKGKPKYENLFEIGQGESATFICPESIYNDKVIWKKDGFTIKPLRKDPHLQVDMFATLYLRLATYNQSGSYTCFIKQKPIQQINVVVKTKSLFHNEEFHNHLQYLGLILIISFIIYIIGVISACTQKKYFKVIDFKEKNTESDHNNYD